MALRRSLLRFGWPRTTLVLVGRYLACVLLLAAPLHALDPDKHISQYIHKSWRIEDGSAPAAINAIAQTSDGFLWFGAGRRGIYRFDGVQFLLRPLSFDGKTINVVTNVGGDRGGGLWVLGQNDILHLKSGVVTSHFALQALAGPNNVTEGPDGSVWVMRDERPNATPLCRVTDQEVKCFGARDGITMQEGNTAALALDGKGGFWLGGAASLSHWQQGVSRTYPIHGLETNTGYGVAALALGPDGTLWVGLFPQGPGLGLGRLVNGVFQSFATPGFDGSKVAVSSLIFDRDGSLWVGTIGNGILRIRGNVVEHYGRQEGLSSDSVEKVFEDKEGIVWTATSNGIDNFRDPGVTTFSAAQGLGLDEAQGVLASRDGSIWVANGDSLDQIKKDGTVSSIRYGKGLPGDQVSSMLEDRDGNLWIGVYDGLYLFKNGHFVRFREPDHQPLGLILGIAQDVNGDILVAGAGKPRRLWRIHNFHVIEQLPQFARWLAADPNGGIWGTAGTDLVLFRGGSFQKFPLNVSSIWISQIVPQSDGSVLAATVDGLVGLRQGKVQRLATKNGLPCDGVSAAIEDKEKHWWLFTECGIVELADSELQRWWADPEAVLHSRVYDTLDGARPGRPSFNAAALSPDGRVWFATGAVVQMVDPSKLSQRAPLAETFIESVVVDRKQLPANSELKIPPHPRDVQIDYTSPTFLIPQRVKFRYRLDGYDRDWHDAGTRRQAFYTDLPPGKYTFRVGACNSDGVWNDSAARLNFSVAPAYYQTNWFRALCAVLFLGLLWAAYQLRVRQLTYRFNMRLEERVSERTRIARELHDTLLQSFHGILLRFQAVSNVLPEGKAKERLEGAIDQAAQAITEGRDAVQGLRSSTVETNDLALAIGALGEELAADENNHSSAEFHVAVEGTPRNVHPILRDEVYRIAGEAMRNAFHHAQARRIEVEIRYDERQLRLRLRDDGIGIDRKFLSEEGRPGHFGLDGMRERTKLVGGKLTVWSELDAGTEVELSIPAATAYATSPRRSWLSEKLSGKGTDVHETKMKS